ncbi:MAG TPA: hypothetical protein PK752_24570, partial [Accumulibacter sp.]|uniref:hypothetical protein n=1 Tax=Accumulibacter sp. TaxID=2053492 RepID=UPI002C3F211E
RKVSAAAVVPSPAASRPVLPLPGQRSRGDLRVPRGILYNRAVNKIRTTSCAASHFFVTENTWDSSQTSAS